MPPDFFGIPDTAICCVAAPAPSTGLSFESAARVRVVDEASDSTPDFGLTLVWLLAVHPPEPVPSSPAPEAFPHRDDATLTYLYTQRLRL
jgi:hypothetical protein